MIVRVFHFLGCYVLVSGREKCQWTEVKTRQVRHGKARKIETYTVRYEGKVVLFNSKSYIFGGPGESSTEIAAGTYRYHFAADLPSRLPQSFGVIHGRIEYKVEAVLDIPWQSNKKISVPFTVLRHVDLNDYAELKVPMTQEEVKSFCCLFCESGVCIILVSIPYGGFATGSKIPIKISYINQSNFKIQGTCVELKRSIKYTSSTPEFKTKTETDTLVEIFANGVYGRQNRIVECLLDVPRILTNSNEAFCKVVQVSYFVEIECGMGECHTNPKFFFPIVIGDIGIEEVPPVSENVNPSAPQIPPPPFPSAPMVQNDLRKENF